MAINIERIHQGLLDLLEAKKGQLQKSGSELLKSGNLDGARAAIDDLEKVLQQMAVVNQMPDWAQKLDAVGIGSFGEKDQQITKVKKSDEVKPRRIVDAPLEEVVETNKHAKRGKAEVGLREDLREREEKVLYATLAINPDRTGFANLFWSDVLLEAYANVAAGIEDPDERRRKIFSHRTALYGLRRSVAKKLLDAHFHPETTPPQLAKFFEWAKTQPEYKNLSIEELINAFNREMTFEEVLEKSAQKSAGVAEVLEVETSEPEVLPGESEENVETASSVVNVDLSTFISAPVQHAIVAWLAENPNERPSRKDLAEYFWPILWRHLDFEKVANNVGASLTIIKRKLLEQNIQLVKEGGYHLVAVEKIDVQPEVLVSQNETSQAEVVVDRELVPEEALPEVAPLFENKEIYQICRIINDANKTALEGLGLNIQQVDYVRCRNMIRFFESLNCEMSLTNEEEKVLEARLAKFVAAKEEVFTANVEETEALIVLAMLAGLDTKEKVLEFLQLGLKK